jgi:hypothetical protein
LHARDALLVALLVAFAWLSSLGPAQSARAQGPAEAESPSPAYAEHIKSALSETALGNFAEAREHFRRAHAIDPSARTLRGLGMVEFELSHYVDSARFLSEALRSNVKPLSGKLRSETEALCERARQYVGSVQVVTDPRSAAVIVDGAVIDLDASRTVTLPVGDHSFEVRSDGRLPAKQVVKVDGGETVRLVLTLVPVAPSEGELGPVDPRTRESPAAAKPLVRKWWFWTTLAVVAAAGGTAAILLTRKHDSVDAYTTRNTPDGSTFHTLWVRGQ